MGGRLWPLDEILPSTENMVFEHKATAKVVMEIMSQHTPGELLFDPPIVGIDVTFE